MWGGLLIYTGHQQKVTALNFRTSRKADRPPAGCRATDASEECWHVFYDDAHVGSIAIRAGNPDGTDPWQWYLSGGRIRRSARPAPRPRRGASRFRERLALVSIKPNQGRFSGVARPIGIGRLRNTAASIAASTCPTIGAPVPDQNWRSNSTSRSNSPTFCGSSLNLPKLSTTRDTSLPDLTAL